MSASRYYRIYVDFDDVVAETARGLADLLHREHGYRVGYEDILFFDLRRSFRLDDDSYRRFMEAAHAPEILVGLEETPGACATLRIWIDEGLAPVVVTGRPPSSHAATRRWLDSRGLNDLEILHVDKYNRDLGEPVPEIPMLRFGDLHRMRFNLAIDDAPLALDLLAESGLCPFVVFDRPWNRTYPAASAANPVRVADWAELDAHVRSGVLRTP